MSEGAVRYDLTDGVATLTLDRPDARNALTIPMRDELLRLLRVCRADSQVRAVLLTGEGPAFCAGMDLSASTAAHAHEPDFDPQSMADALRVGVHAIVTEIWTMPKPVVAAVHGAAIGPGAHLALAADVVVVSPSAKFGWSFSKIGLVVDAGGAFLLPRLVGLSRAKSLVLLSEQVRGDEAVAAGLAYRCVPDDIVQIEARALATGLAAGPTRALGASKRLLNTSSESALADALAAEGAAQALMTTTADLLEGMAAFREKRTPTFEGR